MSEEAMAMLEKLKENVSIRDKMGGAMYWNMLNDECCNMANECLRLGCAQSEIETILGSGTFRLL